MATLYVTAAGLANVTDVRRWLDLVDALQFPDMTPVEINGVAKSLRAGIDLGDLDLSGLPDAGA